ncbi:hypothetical protein JD969_19795 [Planctomycetota bacterium]|nr:hypothetical protein JD969_19795 [Planctomycetota bacterium]
MNKQDSAKQVIIWADSRRVEWVRQIVEQLGDDVSLVGVGGVRDNEVVGLAQELGCDFEDDLRKLLIEKDADYLLSAMGQPLDEDDVTTAFNQGVMILSLEPYASTLHEFERVESLINQAQLKGEMKSRLIRIPAFVRSAGYLSAANPQEVLGVKRTICVENCGKDGTLSLFSRLYDAWYTVLRFIDMPETIDASLVGPLGELPDDLVHITGTLSGHARLGDGGSVLIQVTDRAGQDCRTLHVNGDESELRITDTGYDLRHVNGDVIDHVDHDGDCDFVSQVVNQWRGLIEELAVTQEDAKREIPNGKEVLACCLASLLSARTGQPELPRRALEMSR